MKKLGLILAVYVLSLAAFPCCLVDNCPDEKTEQKNDHDQNDGDCGSCSPFFSCAECPGATIDSPVNYFDFSLRVGSRVYTGYQQVSISRINYDFWQPPKIG